MSVYVCVYADTDRQAGKQTGVQEDLRAGRETE